MPQVFYYASVLCYAQEHSHPDTKRRDAAAKRAIAAQQTAASPYPTPLVTPHLCTTSSSSHNTREHAGRLARVAHACTGSQLTSAHGMPCHHGVHAAVGSASLALQARPGGHLATASINWGLSWAGQGSWGLQSTCCACKAACPSTGARDMTMNRPAAILVPKRGNGPRQLLDKHRIHAQAKGGMRSA
jgi:hypothetical protein